MARINKVVKELVKNVKILRTPKPVVQVPHVDISTYLKLKYPK